MRGMARAFTVRGFFSMLAAIGLSTVLPAACGGTTVTTGSGPGGSEGGCQKDTDCKGARICVGGTCVDPGTTTVTGTGGSSTITVSTSSATGSGGSTTSTSGTGGSSSGSTSTSSGTSTSTSSGTSTSTSTSSGTSTSTSTSSGGACGSNPTVDSDGDGWTPAQGDCNDCDPTVNPG